MKKDQTFLNILEEMKKIAGEARVPSAETSHAEAMITFLTPDRGGRHGPVRSGYRGEFVYEGKSWDAVQQYEKTEWVYPGETIKTYLWFVSPEAHKGNLYPGKTFDICETEQIIAQGTITAIASIL